MSRTKSIKQFVDGMDDSTVKRTKEIFDLCDADGDGIITKAELFKLVKELGYVLSSIRPHRPLSTLIHPNMPCYRTLWHLPLYQGSVRHSNLALISLVLSAAWR